MMPIRTEQSNATFTLDGCNDLPAAIYPQKDGQKIIETCWELTPEEAAIVAKTGRVYVHMLGGVPPMNVEALPLREIFADVQ